MNEVLKKCASLLCYGGDLGISRGSILALWDAMNDMAAEIKRLEAERTEPADPEPPPDLNALAAEKIMGWPRRSSGAYWWKDDDWEPMKNLDHAMLLCRTLRRRLLFESVQVEIIFLPSDSYILLGQCGEGCRRYPFALSTMAYDITNACLRATGALP